MNVLVIGGAGYIGSHVAQALLAANHQVVVFDNLSSGLRENLLPGTTFTHGDIMDPEALRRVLGGDGGSSGSQPIDAIIHLAAFKAAGESMTAPEKYARNNVAGTINILNEASRTGIRRLVFSSSAAVYGEPEYLPVDESHPQMPTNFYGFTKLEIERILKWYDALRSIRFAALRYFNAAGYDPSGTIRGLEQNPANLLPVVMEVAAGLRPELLIFGDDYDTDDGTGVRDYVHVADLADGHVRALEYLVEHDESLTVNLGSESGLSVTQILDTAREVTGKPIPARVVDRRPGDPAGLVASSAFAHQTLGWSTRYSDARTLISTSWEVYRGLA